MEKQDSFTTICNFPREQLGKTTVEMYVAHNSYRVPTKRFGGKPWSLERQEVELLLKKIRKVGVPLKDYVGTEMYRGILTGFIQIFLVD